MIYFVCIGVMVVSAFIGKQITLRIVKRDRFYKDLYEFCGYLKGNIAFFQNKIVDIFDGYIKEYKSDFCGFYTSVKNSFLNNNELDLAIENLKIFKTEEKIALKSFLVGLGKNDQSNQVLLIDNFKQYVSKKVDECSSIRKSREGLIYKLSLAVGAVICILIL